MFSNNSDSDDDSSSIASDAGSWSEETIINPIMTCPDTRCERVMRDHQFLAHLRNNHRIYEYPRDNCEWDKNPFCIRICYRRRRYSDPTSLFFSDSPIPNSWMSGLIKFDQQVFLLHVTEENNEMKLWVTILAPAVGTERNYVANVVLSKPDGTIPPVDQLRQWRCAVREFHGDERDGDHSKFIIPNPQLWRDHAFITECKKPVELLREFILWNIRVIVVNAPILHANLRILRNGERVGGKVFRDFWNARDRPFRLQYIAIPLGAAAADLSRLAILKENDPRPRTCPPAPVTPHPDRTDEDIFFLRLDDQSPLTHIDAVILSKVDGRQGLNEEEFLELRDASKIFSLFSIQIEKIQDVQQEPIPGPSTRPDHLVNDIEAAFFALRLDQPVTPDTSDAGILAKVTQRKDLNNEEFMELKDTLELFRLWQKYILGLLPLPAQ